jgi:hypothetical protein
MSPTVFRWKGYRVFFFSREENRIHVHVYCADGEAKFWLDPEVQLAVNHRLTGKQIEEISMVLQERKHEIIEAWHKHFGS